MNNAVFKKPYKFLSVIVMGLLLMTFASCDSQDDNQIYNRLYGETWVGDLGFYVGRFPVESGITFRSGDYAIDEQYYYDNGGRAATLSLRWWIDYGTLFLDYGVDYPILEIRNVYVGNLYLNGILYVDGAYEGNVELERMTNR